MFVDKITLSNHWIFPHDPLPVYTVCVLKKYYVLIHSLGFVNRYVNTGNVKKRGPIVASNITVYRGCVSTPDSFSAHTVQTGSRW